MSTETRTPPIPSDLLPATPVKVEAPGSGDPAPARNNKRLAKKIIKRVIIVAAIVGAIVASVLTHIYIIAGILGFMILCGVLDVLRHKSFKHSTLDRYFFGNGVLTWLLAPFNLLLDIVSLPYLNKGVYQLTDLPPVYQQELTELLDAAKNANLIELLESKVASARTMIFFKWYGRNIRTSLDIPAFHKEYKTIRTIGVSIFNKRKSTSWHYGPLRATFRVLYNLRPTPDNAAYIQVGDLINRWNDKPLFIFDDTFMHQSKNESDHIRYCMFIDIVRPSKVPGLMNAIVAFLRFLLMKINRSFYSRWEMIK